MLGLPSTRLRKTSQICSDLLLTSDIFIIYCSDKYGRWFNGRMNHLLGQVAMLQRPQVFPLANLTYPSSPQDVPHEFLTYQYSSVIPTNKTPWLRLVTQLLKIPELQVDQLVASTATETGLPFKALARSLQVLTVVWPLIFQSLPLELAHFYLVAVQLRYSWL